MVFLDCVWTHGKHLLWFLSRKDLRINNDLKFVCLWWMKRLVWEMHCVNLIECVYWRKRENNGMFTCDDFQRLYFMSYCIYLCEFVLFSIVQSHKNMSVWTAYSIYVFVIFCMCGEISSGKFLSTSVFLLRPFKIFALFVRVFVLILFVVFVWNCV
jgi:hypothetical protein